MRKLRIHCFQHVCFEGLGCITHWIEQNGHALTTTKFYEEDLIPEPEDYDWLIVMGGPMSVYDEDTFAWLADEKKALKKAMDKNKTVIGICLGSQLIADALGAKVYPNAEKEIGWFEINLTKQAKTEFLPGKHLAEKMMVFHWHGDTYTLPPDSKHLAYSEACVYQAFLYKEKVLGLQFHLEVTNQSLHEMLHFGKSELISGNYIQSETEILAQTKYMETNHTILFEILNHLQNTGG